MGDDDQMQTTGKQLSADGREEQLMPYEGGLFTLLAYSRLPVVPTNDNDGDDKLPPNEASSRSLWEKQRKKERERGEREKEKKIRWSHTPHATRHTPTPSTLKKDVDAAKWSPPRPGLYPMTTTTCCEVVLYLH
ncbi:predicted protein [Histoplasma capsulatum G186AR]|uniref:Uncharacterized protein n=1 Tax=Ajellomyces capsulatus (strain G186AR / H82 / ATCC MYA-2454 / RMSCC 2432) TaxID=447093 RepID=C0NH37_AJECG|nr:uncharacterized protein HCBG_02659 [Histoplasma capsulatum G186AR]EEH09122.1 predicted protein [Histoplasma capsulatum G186AR]